MVNERKTENLVRDWLRRDAYYSNSAIRVEEQKSDSPKIGKLLRNASKRGDGAGYPEFIITSADTPEFLIVIECKANNTKHISNDLHRYSEYAVDGGLLYASYLSKEFDVLAIAVSGETEPTIRSSHYLHLRGALEPVEVQMDFQRFDSYHDNFLNSDIKFRQDYDSLLAYSRVLNEQLQAKKIKEALRGLLICGILVALDNAAFERSYRVQKTARTLANNLVETILNEFRAAALSSDRIGLLNPNPPKG